MNDSLFQCKTVNQSRASLKLGQDLTEKFVNLKESFDEADARAWVERKLQTSWVVWVLCHLRFGCKYLLWPWGLSKTGRNLELFAAVNGTIFKFYSGIMAINTRISKDLFIYLGFCLVTIQEISVPSISFKLLAVFTWLSKKCFWACQFRVYVMWMSLEHKRKKI